jgi:hypothetical protein
MGFADLGEQDILPNKTQITKHESQTNTKNGNPNLNFALWILFVIW